MNETTTPVPRFAWARRHRRPLGVIGAVVAAGMSALWVVVVPEAEAASGVQEAAIRWGHPLCWALLAIVGVLVALGAPRRIRDGVALLAGGSYAAFVIGMLWP